MCSRKSFRLIQLHVESKENFKKNGKILFWNYFAILLISFYTDTDALLVEQINRDYLDATEINGIFLSLDVILIRQRLYSLVLSIHLAPTSSLCLLKKEKFLTEQNNLYTQPYFFYARCGFTLLYKRYCKDSKLIKSYIELIKQNEMEVIIQELWNELGNVSSAAKTLFLHRNTLKYRIEKFQEQSGFNLKSQRFTVLLSFIAS